MYNNVCTACTITISGNVKYYSLLFIILLASTLRPIPSSDLAEANFSFFVGGIICSDSPKAVKFLVSSLKSQKIYYTFMSMKEKNKRKGLFKR